MRSVWLGVAAALLALAVYGVTLCRTVWVGDAPEFALAAACYGVPHPPGYPLHTLLAASFAHLLPTANWALAANAFSALCAALGVWATFGVARALGAAPLAACGAALSLAFATTFWAQAGAAEVYALDTLLLALALRSALAVRATPTARRLLIAALVCGLWVGHRPVNVLLLPCLLACGGAAGWALPWRAWGRALLAAMATGLVYLYLPLASARDPALDIGDPQGLDEFWTVVSASTYRRHLQSGSGELAWARLCDAVVALPLELGLALPLALLGWLTLWRAQRGLAATLALLLAVNLGFSANYNILDIAAYLLPSHCVLAALAGVGATGLRGLGGLLPLGALALLPWHWRSCDLSRHDLVMRLARDVLTQAPAHAVVFCSGDSSTHALWYAQAVEQLRPDVLLVSPGHAHPWYVRQVMRRDPSFPWPPLEEALAGTWAQSVLRAALPKRPVCLLEPPEMRLPGLGAPELVEQYRGIALGPLHLLWRDDQPVPAPVSARAQQYWDAAVLPRAADLAGQDVQLAMVAFSYCVAAFTYAGLRVEQGDLDAGAARLRALVEADPDAIEAAIAAAFATIGRTPPRLAMGERARRALAAPTRVAMMNALSGR